MQRNYGPKIKVLDQGYVQYIQHMGDDEMIVECARVSTDRGFVSWEPYEGHKNGDMGLLTHLFTETPKHTVPFEHLVCTIEIQAPIMVFREWHRHRTQSYSEISARYTPLPNMNYMPTPERCIVVQGKNKQANRVEGTPELTHEQVLNWLGELEDTYYKCQATYELGLQIGVPKELARLCVPVGRYSRMRATTCLLNWLRFLSLRDHPKAQLEIQYYAREVKNILTGLFPRTMGLFMSEQTSLRSVTKEDVVKGRLENK